MKRKIALAMVLAMTASMAQPVLAADSKTTLDVIISQYNPAPEAKLMTLPLVLARCG